MNVHGIDVFYCAGDHLPKADHRTDDESSFGGVMTALHVDGITFYFTDLADLDALHDAIRYACISHREAQRRTAGGGVAS